MVTLPLYNIFSCPNSIKIAIQPSVHPSIHPLKFKQEFEKSPLLNIFNVVQ